MQSHPSQPVDDAEGHAVQPGRTAVTRAPVDHVPGLRARDFSVPVPPTAFGGSGELVAACDPYSDEADMFRDLRGALLEAMGGGTGDRAIAVVSPDAGDGKTYVAANLAITFAQMGTTLLIDADLRHPRLHALFGLDRGPGLGELLSQAFPTSGIQAVADLPGLHLLPAGCCEADPLELLHGPRLGLLLHEVAHQFDAVIIDTPADAQGADARTIAGRAGAALLVGRYARSRTAALETLRNRLRKSRALVAGIVVNQH